MQSLRASHLCYPTSPFSKPYGLPRGNVHRGFAAELRWHRSVERERNRAREVDMENHNAHADAATTLHGAIRRPRKTLRAWHRWGPRSTPVVDPRRPDTRRHRAEPGRGDQTLLAGVRPGERSTEFSDCSSTSRSRSRQSARSCGPHGLKERLRAAEGVVDTGARALLKRLEGVRPARAKIADFRATTSRLAFAAGNR